MSSLLLFYYLSIFVILNSFANCQLAPPRIESIQRIRLNAIKVKWSIQNDIGYQLTRNRVVLYDGSNAIEWPSQAVRVNRDGDDALELETFQVSSYLECVKYCLANANCHFIVRAGRTCYLKAAMPNSTTCGLNQECAIILNYSNEAELFDLPMNRTYRLQVQVYDSKSKTWSPQSQLSEFFTMNLFKPTLLNEKTQILNDTSVRLEWKFDDASTVKPIFYKIFYQKDNSSEFKEWPAQMTEIDIDGYSIDYKVIQNINYFECNNECLKEPRCTFAFRIRNQCTIKALPIPQNQKPCDRSVSSCWTPKEYTNYALLNGLPYDSSFKFQVSVYDEYSQQWTARSDTSKILNYKINLRIRAEKMDEFSYKILINQEGALFPVARYKLLIAKSNGTLAIDQKSEIYLKRFSIPRIETIFNDADATNQGRLSEENCIKLCLDDPNCVSLKLKNDICLTSGNFDQTMGEYCLKNEKCYSIQNLANETLITDLDINTNYRFQIEYFTKYKTRGASNLLEIRTSLQAEIFQTSMTELEPSELNCNANVADSLISQITWKKDNLIINNSNAINAVLSENGRTLQFKNLSHEIHKGKYLCVIRLVKNNQELMSNEYILLIKYGPIFIDSYESNRTFEYKIGDSASFKCAAEGFGPFAFGWIKNENQNRALDVLIEYSNVNFTYESTLNFKSLTRADNGSYSCLIGNQKITTIFLLVPSKPNKPKNLFLKHVDESNVFINWNVDDLGGLVVTQMLIEWKLSDEKLNKVERDIVIDNNFNGTKANLDLNGEVMIRVSLKNALGYGEPSDFIKYVAPPKPISQIPITTLVVAIVAPLFGITLLAVIICVLLRRRRDKTTRI